MKAEFILILSPIILGCKMISNPYFLDKSVANLISSSVIFSSNTIFAKTVAFELQNVSKNLSCFSNEFAQGKIVAYYYIDTQQKQLYYFISSVGKIGKIFGNHDIQVPAVSSNNILPCTTADNGKVLSVVNGEAQWATPKNSVNTNIPSLPADASTSTYVLKAVNGTVQWVKES